MGDMAASGSASETLSISGTVPGGPCCRRRPVVLVPKYACLTGFACTTSEHYPRPHTTPDPRTEKCRSCKEQPKLLPCIAGCSHETSCPQLAMN